MHLLNIEIYIFLQIREFLINRKGEVVFLDFQHLHGLLEEDHKVLVELITSTFDGMLCPQQYRLDTLSLAFLSKNNWQVVIFIASSQHRILLGSLAASNSLKWLLR